MSKNLFSLKGAIRKYVYFLFPLHGSTHEVSVTDRLAIEVNCAALFCILWKSPSMSNQFAIMLSPIPLFNNFNFVHTFIHFSDRRTPRRGFSVCSVPCVTGRFGRVVRIHMVVMRLLLSLPFGAFSLPLRTTAEWRAVVVCRGNALDFDDI